jgi:hypothetical protein
VKAVKTIAILLLLAGRARAQAPAPPPPQDRPEPFGITDNSFLLEEAFNQDVGVVQNIFGATRLNHAWQMTLTQEWPIRSVRHQFSYTFGADSLSGHGAFSDTYLNYRFQAMEEGPGKPAFASRVTAILPTGRTLAGQGLGGMQVGLALSKRKGDVYFHWNGGFTWRPRGERPDFVTPGIEGSLVYGLRPMLNLMLESAVTLDADDNDRGGIQRTATFTISPGVRGGWNLGDSQIVIGLAMPYVVADERDALGAFGYFSYELPFKRNR